MLIVKILGLIMIFISVFLYGYYNSLKIDFRISDLVEFKKALSILKSEIQYSRTTLPEAMIEISKRTDKVFSLFFKNITDKIHEREGEGIHEIWSHSFNLIADKNYLEKEDMDNLKSIGACLGYLDRELQLSNLNIGLEYIESKVSELKIVSIKNKRLYSSLGMLGGIITIIILL